MTDWIPFGAGLAAGVLATLLAVLLALRRLAPRPDLTWAWALWALTALVALITLLGAMRAGAAPPGAMPAPTPP